MDIVNTILRFDGATRLAILALALTSLAWLVSMIVGLAAKKGKKSGIRGFEIAIALLSLLLVASMTFAGQALEKSKEPPPDTTPAATAASGGGTGTCASVRPGMKTSQVKGLLGTPSLEKNVEDAGGPGATVMVFDDSRCVVYFIHGVVEQIE